MLFIPLFDRLPVSYVRPASSAILAAPHVFTNPSCPPSHGFTVMGLASPQVKSKPPKFWSWAKSPPMGWNSWDGFATTVTEAQVRAQIDVMAKKLRRFGWKYVVVDIQWYEPNATGFDYRNGAILEMDGFGRLLPAPNKFPSSAAGLGFRPLSDDAHQHGLQFGVHLMRGIPRQAVALKTPIQGTSFSAADIADKGAICGWNQDMYGVDMSKSGAQNYYDSVFRQFAQWGIDFVKVDDLSRPYHKAEIEAIRKAIDRSGRPMVLSTSPGDTPLKDGLHVQEHANMWRISDDFWDNWPSLVSQFKRLREWSPYQGAGHFPDADMLPIGTLQMGKAKTNFTKDEQKTLLSLWCIARSPLMIGADLTKLDEFTLSLLTNPEVLGVDRASENNHELFHRGGLYGWIADIPRSRDRYLAVFNTNDSGALASPVHLSELGMGRVVRVRDLWQRHDLGTFEDSFSPTIPSHGAGLFRISPASLPSTPSTDPYVPD